MLQNIRILKAMNCIIMKTQMPVLIHYGLHSQINQDIKSAMNLLFKNFIIWVHIFNSLVGQLANDQVIGAGVSTDINRT